MKIKKIVFSNQIDHIFHKNRNYKFIISKYLLKNFNKQLN